MNSGVYSILNTANGYRYVGSAINFSRRREQHRRGLRLMGHDNSHLQRAWDKYGESSFVFEVLEECEVSRLIEREQWWIDCAQPEYNICRVAGSSLGVKRTEETRRRVSDGRRGKKASPETRLRMSESHKGKKRRPFTEEHRLHLSESHKGKPHTEEHRLHLSEAMKRRPR